jgi:O-glycosyl hydrolase
VTRTYLLAALLLATLAGGCGSERPAAGVPVTVTKGQRQTIQAWGTGVANDTIVESLAVPAGLSRGQLARLDRLAFVSGGINLVRVFGPGGLGSSEQGAAGVWGPDNPRLAFMRRVRRYGVRFMLTGADAPARLKDGGYLAHGAEAEYAAYLASVLRAARDAGAPFSYAAVMNEPDNGKSPLQLSPEQAARVYAALAALVAGEHMDVRLVPGDNTGWDQTVRYAPPELAAPGVRRASAAVASHAYSGDAGDRLAVARLARRSGVPVWQTEWTTGCPDCGDEDTMARAIPWALEIIRSLTHAQASAWLSFRGVADSTHGSLGGMIVRRRGDPRRPFYTTKRFDVFRQFTTAGRAGSRRVVVSAGRGGPPVVAFARGSRLSVVLVNPSSRRRRVALGLGSKGGSLTGRRTSPSEGFSPIRSRDYRGRPVGVRLPAMSVTSYVLRR